MLSWRGEGQLCSHFGLNVWLGVTLQREAIKMLCNSSCCHCLLLLLPPPPPLPRPHFIFPSSLSPLAPLLVRPPLPVHRFVQLLFCPINPVSKFLLFWSASCSFLIKSNSAHFLSAVFNFYLLVQPSTRSWVFNHVHLKFIPVLFYGCIRVLQISSELSLCSKINKLLCF